MAEAPVTPNPIDQHVGLRLRLCRKTLGLSQERLAEGVGLTFQQIQKYERGANRISASKLFELGRLLNVPVAYFFEGLANAAEGEGGGGETQLISRLVAEPQGAALAEAFLAIPSRRLRARVLGLICEIAGHDAAPDGAGGN